MLMKVASESVNGFWLAALALLLALCLHAAPLRADPLEHIRQVNMDYTIYLGGLHVLDSKAHFTRNGQSYKIHMTAGTQGFFNMVAPWDADLVSGGKLEKESIQPKLCKVVTRWQDDAKEVVLDFKDDGRVEARFNPPEGDKHEKVPDDLMKGVLDPLSGVVQVMASFAYGKGCSQLVPLFDGHRRFDLELRDAGTAQLKGDGYSIFEGEAQKCEALLTMRAGSRKDREGSRFWEDAKGKKTRPPVYIYLAKVRPELPQIPVRAETQTPFGSIIVHLKDVTFNADQSAAANP